MVGSRPLFEFGDAVKIDLSDPLYLSDTQLQGYVAHQLLAEQEPRKWTPYRNQSGPAKQVAEAVAAKADGVFLVARIVSRLLTDAKTALDVSVQDWKARLPSNVSEAFEDYLEQFGPLNQKVRDVLLPLAYAQGQGLPWESFWAPLAAALSGRAYGDADIREVLAKASPFIIEGKEEGRSAYRLYHQELITFFQQAERSREKEIQNRFVTVLQGSVPRNGEDWDYARAHPYLLRYLPAHAAAAERMSELVSQASFLAACDPLGLLPYLQRSMPPEVANLRDCYLLASHLLLGASWNQRVSYLELIARRQNWSVIGDGFATLTGRRGWRAVWARWRNVASHRILRGHDFTVTAVAVTEYAGRRLIVSGSEDRTIRVWDLETGEARGEPLRGHMHSVTAVAVIEHAGRPLIVSGSYDGTVRVWDLERAEARGEPLRGHGSTVSAVAVTEHAGRQLIVSGSADNTLRVWDLGTGEARGEPLRGHERSVTAVAVTEHAGRQLIVSGSFDNTVRVWGLETGEMRGQPLRGHDSAVKAVAVTEQTGRQVIVSGSDDKTVRVWDVETRQALRGAAVRP